MRASQSATSSCTTPRRDASAIRTRPATSRSRTAIAASERDSRKRPARTCLQGHGCLQGETLCVPQCIRRAHSSLSQRALVSVCQHSVSTRLVSLSVTEGLRSLRQPPAAHTSCAASEPHALRARPSRKPNRAWQRSSQSPPSCPVRSCGGKFSSHTRHVITSRGWS